MGGCELIVPCIVSSVRSYICVQYTPTVIKSDATVFFYFCFSPMQILPKVDGQIQIPSNAPGGPNNVLIPQGIQHVLINGQLYPIIQTANGTHLLIQQPVGQVQQAGGKQVFTAQPIQLGNLPPGQAPPGQPLPPGQTPNNLIPQQLQVQPQMGAPVQCTTGSGQQVNLPQPLQKFNQVPNTSQSQVLQPVTAVPVSLNHPPNQPPNSNFGAMPVASSSGSTAVQQTAGNVPIPSMAPVSNSPLTSSKPTPIQSLPNTSTAAMIPVRPNQPMPMNFPTGNGQVTISPQTQQLLNKINEQIEILKRKQDLDAQGKKALTSLLQAQQHVMNNVRQQIQMYSQRAPPGSQQRLANPQQFGGAMQAPVSSNSVPAPLQPPGPPVTSGAPPVSSAGAPVAMMPPMPPPGLATLSANTDVSKKIVEPGMYCHVFSLHAGANW